MSDALIQVPTADVPKPYTDKDWDEASKAGDYLPRLQLMTAAADKCKSGEFPINHFALVNGQNFIDLGETVSILVIEWRPKAIEMGEEVISVFDTGHPEFSRIRALSAEKDSRCMYGPEFLVWVPGIEKFATFFMGTKSMRREANLVREQMQKAVTLKPHKIVSSKYTWFSPKVELCTTVFDLPGEDEISEEYKKFVNPPQQTIERVQEKDQSTRAR
jgi:hypothetical protein